MIVAAFMVTGFGVVSVHEVAGDRTVLTTVVVVLGVGALLLASSLVWLFDIFRHFPQQTGYTRPHRRRNRRSPVARSRLDWSAAPEARPAARRRHLARDARPRV